MEQLVHQFFPVITLSNLFFFPMEYHM